MTPAYTLGQQAFNDGIHDSPYALDSEEHEDWVQGWQAAGWAAICDEDTGDY